MLPSCDPFPACSPRRWRQRRLSWRRLRRLRALPALGTQRHRLPTRRLRRARDVKHIAAYARASIDSDWLMCLAALPPVWLHFPSNDSDPCAAGARPNEAVPTVRHGPPDERVPPAAVAPGRPVLVLRVLRGGVQAGPQAEPPARARAAAAFAGALIWHSAPASPKEAVCFRGSCSSRSAILPGAFCELCIRLVLPARNGSVMQTKCAPPDGALSQGAGRPQAASGRCLALAIFCSAPQHVLTPAFAKTQFAVIVGAGGGGSHGRDGVRAAGQAAQQGAFAWSAALTHDAALPDPSSDPLKFLKNPLDIAPGAAVMIARAILRAMTPSRTE